MSYRKLKPWGILKPPLGSRLDPSHPLSRGVIGAWLLNEAGGGSVNEISQRDVAGTLGTGVSWTNGIGGPCLNIASTTTGGVPLGALPSAPNFTIALRINTLNLAQTFGTLVRLNLGFPGVCGLFQDGSAIAPIVLVVNNANSKGCAVPSTGQWHYIVGTYDGTNSKVYLDGFDKTIAKSDSTWGPNVNGIAVPSGSSTPAYRGLYDSLIVYNRALSASEVKRLYEEPYAMFSAPRIKLGKNTASNVVNSNFLMFM